MDTHPICTRERATQGSLLWDSHSKQVLLGQPRNAATAIGFSDLIFEGSNCEGLYNSLGWVRLHLHILAKDIPDTRLGGWLHTSLDPAEARDCEDAILLHLASGKFRQAVKKARHSTCFELMFVSQGFDNSTL